MGKEKKEIGKLIELLNEYQYGMFVYENDLLLLRIWSNVKVGGETFIISKKFGFIKWLVENDKIDVEKIEKRNLIPLDASLWHKVDDTEKNNVSRLWTTKILMLLSISDTPIEDLISYLK